MKMINFQVLKSARLILLFLFFVHNAANAHANNTVVTDPIHKTNVGKIIFTDQMVGTNGPCSALFLKDYKLTNKSNLFITVFLAKTMGYYLQQLSPDSNIDSLIKRGNYQFSFYVDEKLVYQSNLLPGAPRADAQKTLKLWTKPLIDNEHEGAWWSQSAWNRFMFNGGDVAMTEGKHTLKIELRPYVKLEKLLVGDVIASGSLNLVVNRKPVVSLNHIKLSPLKAYDGFAVSEERFDQEKIKALKAYAEAGVFKHITSVVVIKNGKLLVEEYFNGANRDSLHDVRSVGKSFASTMTGIAIADGLLKSEEEKLGTFYQLKDYDHYSLAKGNTSLKELLTMRSRFDGNDDDSDSPGNEENMYPTPNWVKFALDLPFDTLKYKGQWHYFTVGVMLLGSTLNQLVPGDLEKYADEKLFKPLDITQYQWQYTPQHVASTAGGIRMNALDFAKYGQLYQNNGLWKGKQIIPKQWVDKTLSKQTAITGRKEEYYGYLFWNKKYTVKGKAYETFYASGNGGNKIFIFKDQPLVVVVTATAYGTNYAHAQVDKMMEEYILPAVIK
ncbi:serine hydrolase domain-containing protein [Pedobacter psychrodurus]|uniref:serine hydrolase domain-containing protein n=1 Tax=Pedobacter psychrodurus TaxID=2530456 RepID=UPI00292D47F1|nr:serine hydrolase domain-containing protein [Pedobacter psychrodurus]